MSTIDLLRRQRARTRPEFRHDEMSRSHTEGLALPVGLPGLCRLVIALAFATVLLVVLVQPQNAGAALSREQVGAFGADGTLATSFTNPNQLTIQQSEHKLYVLDSGADEIDGFGISAPPAQMLLGGAFPLTVESTGGSPDVATDNSPAASAGNLYYLSESSGLYGFGASGTPLGGSFPVSGFGDPCGDAVDPSGNVWVGDYGASAVKEFSASGASLGSVDTSEQGKPCHVAFDANSDLYAAMYQGTVWKYTAASGYIEATQVTSEGSAQGLTVDRGTHDVYVVYREHVSVYSQTGSHLYDFAGGISGEGLAGVAADEANNEVYVSDAGNGKVRLFGTPVLVAGATTESASEVTTSSATLTGTVNSGGAALSDCHFEYGTSTAYVQSAPCVPAASAIPADTEDHAVTAQISGLVAGTTYHFRLVITNAKGTIRGSDETLRTTGATIESEQATSVGLETATLSAEVTPNNQPTAVYVEYGTSTTYGNATTESASIGADEAAHEAVVTLGALTPGTTYHWRLVAVNASGKFYGPDRSFTTQQLTAAGTETCPNSQFRGGLGALLPDCRAYEQVTEVDKNGGDPGGSLESVRAAADGSGITFFSQAGVPGGVGAATFPTFLARRTGERWSTQGVLPPQQYGEKSQVLGYSSDLLESFSEVTNIGAGVTLLRQDDTTKSFQTLVPDTQEISFKLDGTSADDSQVYFQANEPLTPDALSDQENIYVAQEPSGTVGLVDRLPDGTVPAAGAFIGPYDWSDDETSVGGVHQSYYLEAEHAISSDGSRIVFTAAGSGQIYQRVDPNAANASTIHVSATQKTNGTGPGGADPAGPKPAAFLAASTDGAKLLFMSHEELTNNANTGEEDAGNDMYVYDTQDGSLSDIAPDASGAGAEVVGLMGASDDTSYVYFVANGVLATGASQGDCTFSSGYGSGTCSLYLWHNGTTSFVASFNGASEANDINPSFHVSGGYEARESRVSPDGRTLLFAARASVTSYQTDGQSELYRYTADDGRIRCVSCDPSGAAPQHGAQLKALRIIDFLTPVVTPYLSRNLSDDGQSVFFETDEALLPRDTNGTNDVYEWEADGSGSCSSELADGGCLSLLSTGQGDEPAYFGDASSSGSDVFIFTSAQLAPVDEDQLYDIYDLRVGGGLALQHPPTSGSCSGEGCRSESPSPSQPPSAASVTFVGPGNLTSLTTAPAVKLAKVSIDRSPVKGASFSLKVNAPSSGAVSASGASIRASKLTVASAGAVRMRIELTSKAKRALRRKRKLMVKIKVTFTPRSGAASSAELTLNVKAPGGSR
jgi:WD40-like Beta Propeller Repeat